MKITINGGILEWVMSFSYLGHVTTDNGSSETKMKKRTEMVKNLFNIKKRMLTSGEINNT